MDLKGFLYRRMREHKHPAQKSKSIIAQMLEIKTRNNYDWNEKITFDTSENLISIPPNPKEMIYPLIKPYAYAKIKFNKKTNEIIYNVIEPRLTDYEKQILEKLKEGMMQIININFNTVKKMENMLDFLEKNIRKLIIEYNFHINQTNYIKIMYYIFRDFIGLNQIEPLLKDPYIEDIGLDGIGIPVFVVHQKFGSLRTNIIFEERESLVDFVTKLAERCDKYISYAEPMFDGSLPDGTRVQATLANDVTTRGPTFSIRKFREIPFSPVDMIRMNTASPEMLAYLWFVVENGINILIAGGVATGKTSFLNCISVFIPSESKIVSIEDTRELSLPHDNWIPGVARTGFSGTIGEVTMFDLLKESFRQNPDYLIVGEIRGNEAYVMFQGMASGHPSFSTIHAGSLDDVIKRLQTKPINISPGLLEALDLVILMVHAREKGKSARRVRQMFEIESIDAYTGTPRSVQVFNWTSYSDVFEYSGSSWILDKISREKGISLTEIKNEISRRKKILNWMFSKNITDMREVMKYINAYRKSPIEFMKKMKI